MENRLTRLEVDSNQTKLMVREIHEHVVGKPGTEGLTTRVSKVEQRISLQSKVGWTWFSAVLGIIVAKIKGWV